MPSSRRQASYNPTLTNFAVGLAQSLMNSLANFISPIVEVGSTIGQYKSFDTAQAFRSYNTRRATGGNYNRIEFSSDDPSYNCQPNGLEVTVDDDERDAAGDEGDAQARLEQGKVQTLVSNCVTSHEVDVFGKVRSLTTAMPDFGKWRDPSVDPILEWNAAIEQIATQTGIMPNRTAIGLPLFNILANHPKVIARQPGAAVIGASVEQLARMLINPGMEIKVGILSYDSSKPGGVSAKSNIVGASLYVFHASQTPSQYDPSWFKTFQGRRGGVTRVETYRDEKATSDVHRVKWSRDVQQVSALCGKRIDLRAN